MSLKKMSGLVIKIVNTTGNVLQKAAPKGPTLRSCEWLGLKPSWLMMDGEKRARPKRFVPPTKKTMNMKMTWGEVNASKTCFIENLSTGLTNGLSLSNRAMITLI